MCACPQHALAVLAVAAAALLAVAGDVAAQRPFVRPPDRHRDPPPNRVVDPEGEADARTEGLVVNVPSTRGLQQIEAFIAREKWPEVVAGLQQLVEGSQATGDSFARGPSGELTSLQRLAVERIRNLPPAGLRLYQEVYGGAAADLLTQARRTGDMVRILDVARRYLNTDAGAEAAIDAALSFFDRGEYLACVRWIESLSPQQREEAAAAVQVKYALALLAADRADDAEAVLTRVRRLPQPAGAPATERLPAGWESATPPRLATTAPQADWPVLYGNALHTGSAPPSAPLLVPQWSAPMTFIPAVQEQVQMLQADLQDAGRSCIPATLPVVVGNRLAVRTLRGVVVLDLATGKSLWEQPIEPASPDRLLSGTFEGNGLQRAEQFRVAAQSLYTASESGNFDQHPLTGLVFQDSVSGNLSSDGRRLFVLTQHAMLARSNQGYWIGPQQQDGDPFGRDWSSNVITAYELETGAERWQVGGPRTGEPFDRLLAGTFFFGAPIPAGDELYVVGERDNEVSLFVLDRDSGHPRFVQPLAVPTARIDVDASRRLWACPPAVSNGVVVCPTTTGWTVAVDRVEQRVLWAHASATVRGADRGNGFGGAMVQPVQPLNVRWETSPPIISGRKVVIAPQESPGPFHDREPAVICLDLETGRELWRQAKQEDGLFVGCVRAERVLIVGRSRLRGLSLDDGKEAWTATLPVDAPPSGRGVVSGDDYLLPLANGQLWSVHIADGRVADRLESQPGEPPLGNLVAAQQMLISTDALQVRGFTERSVLEAEIAAHRRRQPDDLWAAIQEAQLERMKGNRERAIEVLRSAEPAAAQATADPQLASEWRALHRELLVALVSSDLGGRDDEYELLCRTNDVRADPELRRLGIERALKRKTASAAWDLLWPPQAADAAAMVRRGALELQAAAWEAGRLAATCELADDALRAKIDAAVQSAVEPVLQSAEPANDSQRLEALLAFHPQGRRLSAFLAEQAEGRDDFAGAELRWRRLYAGHHGAESWRAGLRLAAWLAAHDQTLDARRVLADLKVEIHDLDAASQAAAETEFAQRTAALGLSPDGGRVVLPSWTDATLAAVAKPRGQEKPSRQDVAIAPAREAFYEQHLLQFDSQSQRLRVLQPDGTDYWSLPLRSQRRPMYDQTIGLRTDGQQAYCVWQGVIQALSLPDRTVRWSFPIDLRMSAANYVRNVELEEQYGLLPADQFVRQWSLPRYRAPTGMAAAASPDYVLLHGRRAVSLLDALTGELRWTRTGLSPQTMIYGDGPRVYGFPSDGSDPFLLRTVDGEEVPQSTLARWSREAIAIRDGVLATVKPSASPTLFGLYTPKTKLAGIDVATGETRWTHAIDGGARLGWLSETELLVLDSKSQLSVVDIQTGAVRDRGALPGDVPRDNAPVQRLVDGDSLYLLFDRDWQRMSHYVMAPHLQINGYIVCVALDGSGVRWHRRISEQRLLTSNFRSSPVLAFFNQLGDDDARTGRDNLHRLQIEVWDKRTGRTLLQSGDLQVSHQTFQLEQDFSRRTLRLLGQSLQVVIEPGPPPLAPNALDGSAPMPNAPDDSAPAPNAPDSAAPAPEEEPPKQQP